MIEEVVKMDAAIQATENKMAMIMRDPEMKHAYDMFEMARIDYKMGMQGARLKGERKGKREGKLEIARNLKKLGVPLEQIVLGTGLSAEEIAKL